jgi:hypothetical protein
MRAGADGSCSIFARNGPTNTLKYWLNLALDALSAAQKSS